MNLLPRFLWQRIAVTSLIDITVIGAIAYYFNADDVYTDWRVIAVIGVMAFWMAALAYSIYRGLVGLGVSFLVGGKLLDGVLLTQLNGIPIHRPFIDGLDNATEYLVELAGYQVWIADGDAPNEAQIRNGMKITRMAGEMTDRGFFASLIVGKALARISATLLASPDSLAFKKYLDQ